MNRFAVIPEFKEQRELMDSAYSFALVRDPKERLISAWKSKIACGGEYHTDFDTRQWMVSELRLLANMTCRPLTPDHRTCLRILGPRRSPRRNHRLRNLDCVLCLQHWRCMGQLQENG